MLWATLGMIQTNRDASTENWIVDDKFSRFERRVAQWDAFETESTNDLPEESMIH